MRAPTKLLVYALVAVTLFAARPARAADDDWFGRDKALHFSVSAILASGTYAVSAAFFDARYPPLLLGAGVSLGAGVGKELADLAGMGTPSWKDLAWDVIGTVAGLAVAYGLDLAIRGVSREHPALGLPETSPRTTRYLGPSPGGLVLRF